MKSNPFQPLPESVVVDGVSYPINYDFRMGVAIETEILSDDKPDVYGLLFDFYKGNIPRNVDDAVNKMVWFYGCGDQDNGDKRTEDTKGGRQYDFDMDADVLLASFYTAYGIDLSTASIHWFAFRRLMLNLPANTPFMDRVKYRVADLKKLGKEERKHYKKMQQKYAIKKRQVHMTVEERDAALLEKIKRRYEEAQNATESQ